MSEILRPIPFSTLLEWIFTEYKSSKSIFGIRKFYKNKSGKYCEMFGEKISSAVGPAAGPATQLSQNIIAGYLAGARFIELKTVQVIDGEDLRKCVPRPCIKAVDECYNCEWSTELTVEEAYEEYVKAFILIIITAKELRISSKRDFLFNMSVGYDFEGITSSKIDSFINNMCSASGNPFFNKCLDHLKKNIKMFKNVTEEDIDNLDTVISNSITLSTLHGCPPEEIEKISLYFLKEKKIHTYVKCNPTLLGFDFTRNILDNMGYSYMDFDDTHFKQDLKYPDAVSLIRSLQEAAEEENLDFGVKITNTFPVKASRGELPSEFMYMSGRALYPLSLNTASKLSDEFDGNLPISFSGGIDFFNIKELFKTGVMPITAATTILKPGGYERFKQLSEEIEEDLSGPFRGVDEIHLKKMADNAANEERHKKGYRYVESRKTSSNLPLFDCFKSPCSDGGCPINQQIPSYLEYVSKRDYKNAFKVIAVDNALPAVTAAICNHDCQFKCTRLDYESSLQIREAKKIAVENEQDRFIKKLKKSPLRTDKKAAVIGGGPAGISAAVYLRRNGVAVTVFEKSDRPMGIVEHIIPEFRISHEMIKKDIELSLKTGVEYVFNCDGKYDILKLKDEFDFIILATGAWEKGLNSVTKGKEKVLDSLEFLKKSKVSRNTLEIGKRVAVIGGGDVAMDCVREAKRTEDVERADILYRRTKEFMPVSREELDLTVNDGINIIELLSPVEYDGEKLTLEVMELKTADAERGGRPSPVPTGELKILHYDTVISAVGARVGTDDFVRNSIKLNSRGFPALNDKYESSIKNVYVSGDCRSGSATIVKAMGSSRIIAMDILEKLSLSNDFINYNIGKTSDEIYSMRAVLIDDKLPPGELKSRSGSSLNSSLNRCLNCGDICELCVEVCPNRANIAVELDNPDLKDRHQIIHIDGMCNECGSCGVFCPHEGNPYLDKVTLFSCKEDFENSENCGFLKISENLFRIRDSCKDVFDADIGSEKISAPMRSMINAVSGSCSYLFYSQTKRVKRNHLDP